MFNRKLRWFIIIAATYCALEIGIGTMFIGLMAAAGDMQPTIIIVSVAVVAVMIPIVIVGSRLQIYR